MKLTEQEFNDLLSEPGQLARIGSVSPDGVPTVLPYWFIHRDDRLFVTVRSQSPVIQYIEQNPNVCFCIDEQVAWDAAFSNQADSKRESTGRKVILWAEARFDFLPGQDREWRDLYRDMARKYFTPQATEDYLNGTKHIARYVFSVPCKYGEGNISTVRLPGEGEDTSTWGMPKKYWPVTVPTGL